MPIRSFQAGDEAAQVSIYNEATAGLAKSKPATLDELRRRSRGGDFDPSTRLFALEGGQAVGYISFHANGRIGYPWCRKGHEAQAEPLFEAAIAAMRKRGSPRAIAAYRADWTAQHEFYLAHGFQNVREMVNFVVDLVDMPTPAARRSSTLSPLTPQDLPHLVTLATGALRTTALPELEKHFFHNPYFPPEALFALRSRADATPTAVGLLIVNDSYADAKTLDAGMPCFRLGAFGTEGMQSKRVNGLFSFMAKPEDANRQGLDLLGHAAFRLQKSALDAFAAQVPSDVPHLFRFYQSHFRRQGTFPVFERNL